MHLVKMEISFKIHESQALKYRYRQGPALVALWYMQ